MNDADKFTVAADHLHLVAPSTSAQKQALVELQPTTFPTGPTPAAKSAGLAMLGCALFGVGILLASAGRDVGSIQQAATGFGIAVGAVSLICAAFGKNLLASQRHRRVIIAFNSGGLLLCAASIILIARILFAYVTGAMIIEHMTGIAIVWFAMSGMLFAFGGALATPVGLLWQYTASRRGVITTLGCGKHTAANRDITIPPSG